VVVVGGGPAGVEAAAEVVEAYAGKAVTVVHPGKQLLPTMPPKGGAKARQWLESHGVKVGGSSLTGST
jgi:NADH dehydrogenase FAD-containing subunit